MLRLHPDDVANRIEDAGQRYIGHLNAQLAGFDTREIERIVDQRQQMLAATVDHFDRVALTLVLAAVAQQNLRIAEDAVQRRAQFMAHVREEFALGPVGGFGQVPGLPLLSGVALGQIGVVQPRAHVVERGRHAIELVGPARLTARQDERLRRSTEIVFANQPGNCGEMPGYEAREDVDGEQRNDERIGGLTDQNDKRGLRQRLIEIGQRCLHIERADLLLCPVDTIKDRKFAGYHGARHARARRHHHRRRARSGLANLGGAQVGQPQDAVQLKLKLSAVELPQTLAEAVAIASVDVR